MNDRIWAGLKIVAAVAATLLVYNFLDSGSSIEINKSSLIDSSIEKLGEILSSSIEDFDARKEAELEFKEFSDLVTEGEISPDELEDIASSILNMRMVKSSDVRKSSKEIIRELKRVRATSSFIIESPEELELKLDSIAVKIKDLTTFQEEYYQQFFLSEKLADLKNTGEIPEIAESNEFQILIDFEPVVVVPKAAPPANLRKETEMIIVGKTLVDMLPIRISEKLNLLIDYSKLNKMDSLKIVLFHKKLNELKSIKTIINDSSE